MAGGSEHGEMNPFISYVDLFSSVILVLLLFVLIMFVNVGYYMQFNSKQVTVAAAASSETASKQEENPVTFVTLQDVTKATTQRTQEIGENTLTKSTEKTAIVDYKESDLTIVFKNNDYFVAKDAIAKLTKTMEKILKSNPNALFVLSVGDSKKILSATQAKQISLGRVLATKNTLEATPAFKNKIKISYKQNESNNFEFGYLKVDVK